MAEIVDFGLARLYREEDEFHAAIWAALLRHDDDESTGTMRCPICGNLMDCVRRDDRMTFAGPEPACVQYQCDPCGFGGECERPP